ncbi:MAG TPA: oxygenase MpaB family protein [Burkholderiaceae bacterium]|nr:oxygenase MpaB family protein [Burkholderiaceae bacterium]
MRLPTLLRHRLETGLTQLIWPHGLANDDFLHPLHEPALVAPDSITWQVFKNPLALFIGGVTAVVLELAEPRVRSGVWQNTSFRERPLERMRRTGYAAMMTVYGSRSRAESMIDNVTRRHALIHGVASDGRSFRATDPELLEWVHTTACFGFVEAYHAYVRPLSPLERDRFYAESVPAAERYGAASAPASAAAVEALFDRMGEQLEGSDVVLEFLSIMRHVAALPEPLRPLQGVLIRASIQIIPEGLRDRIGLGKQWALAPWQRRLVRASGGALDRLMLASNPAVQGCRRLGLPDNYLYSRR